jgi:hypothetical protein
MSRTRKCPEAFSFSESSRLVNFWEEVSGAYVFLLEAFAERNFHPVFARKETMQGIRNLALGLSVLGASLFACGASHASDCYYGHPRYKTVTVYQTVKVPHYSYVTKYHSCGTPYRIQVVYYRTVTVPVQKQVRIGY